MNISILLPYKENFVSNKAGAVSLFVNDTHTFPHSRYLNHAHTDPTLAARATPQSHAQNCLQPKTSHG